MNALKIAATGMLAQQTTVDLLSNNIANVNTTAFKRQRVAFHDLLYMNDMAPGATTSSTGTIAPTGIQTGLGVQVGATYRVFEQGAVIQTEGPLDMSIQGRGFFRIIMPDGSESYTRDGSFQLNEAGDVVTSDGFELDPGINLPPEAINLNIANDGTVSATVDGDIAEFGQITIVMFQNEAGLEAIGDNLYEETEASGAPLDVTPGEEGSGGLLQAHLESSNVDPIESVTDLIAAQRAYELNSRIISTADEMLNAVNQMR